MSNYIKSELFRLRKNKVIWGLMAITILWMISASCSMEKGYFLEILSNSMTIPYILTVVIGVIVVADGFKNKIFNNEKSYGLSENKIYFSKIIVSAICGAVLFVIVDITAIIVACIFNGVKNLSSITMLLGAEGVMFIACVASIVCFMTVFFITKKSIVSVFIWFILAISLNDIACSMLVKIENGYETACKYILSCAVFDCYDLYFESDAINIIVSSIIMIVLCVVCKYILKKEK